MKTSRFKYQYRKSASSLHKIIGDILRQSEVFKCHEIFQEYPVSRVNPSISNNRLHYDWVVPKLKIVIEGQGKQHSIPVAFDGNTEASITNFHELKKRDKIKRLAALDAGYTFIEIPYFLEKELNESKLLSLYDIARKELETYQELSSQLVQQKQTTKRKEFLQSKIHKNILQKARDYRKQQYQRLKSLRNK